MSRPAPITPSDVEAELARMRAEIEELKARPQSPHAQVIREFEEDHQRRVRAGQKVAAEQHAAEQRKLDQICASRSWVRVTCANTKAREISWHETVEEAWGASEFHSANGPRTSGGPSGRWVMPMVKFESLMALAGAGHMLEIATEFTRRIVNSPELAKLVETGQLIVTPLSPAECRAHELSLLRTADAVPLTMRAR